jgi:hypothetical protein
MIHCCVCDRLVEDDDVFECPTCGALVCEYCYNGEMCERCQGDFDCDHSIFGS